MAAITLAMVCSFIDTCPLLAQERTIWLPVSPPQQSAPPRAPVQVEGSVEVTFPDGSKHTLAKVRLGTEDTQFSATALQMDQTEYDSMFILPINTMTLKKRNTPPWECYYSVLIPMHRVKSIVTRPRDESGFGFPVVVTLRDSADGEIVGEAYGSAIKFWHLYLTGTENLGGFGDQIVTGFLGPTNGVGHVQFFSVTLPDIPVKSEPKERSSRSALIVDVSSQKHRLQDIRVPDRLRCQNAGGTIEVPLDKVAGLSSVRTRDSQTQLEKTTWTVRLRSGDTREFSFVGIYGIAGRGERFFECIPVDSISTVDFTESSETNKVPSDIGVKH